MKKWSYKVAVFSICIAIPGMLYAYSGGRPIPKELLDISCKKTQCSPKTFSAIKSIYRPKTSCGYNFKIGPRLRIAFLNIFNSHYRNYHFSLREYCQTGILPERENIEGKASPTNSLVKAPSDEASPGIEYASSYNSNGLSMQAPKGWVFLSPSEMRNKTKGKMKIATNTIFFVVNETDYASNINVQYIGDTSRDASNVAAARKLLKEIQQQIVVKMRQSLPSFKKIKAEVIKFSNGVALNLVFTSLKKNVLMKQKQLIIISNKKAFTITFTAKENVFSKYFSTGFEPILRSIKIGEPAGTKKIQASAKPINFKGELIGLLPEGGGEFRYSLEKGDKLYDLRFSDKTEFIGFKEKAFQLGDLYDVKGTYEDTKFILSGLGTIVVDRMKYLGKPGLDNKTVHQCNIKTIGQSSKKIHIAVSPDGKLLVTRSWDGVKLWALPDGKYLTTLTGHDLRMIQSLAVSPNSKMLATGNFSDGTIKLWSLPEGKYIKTIKAHNYRHVSALAIRPNGRLLVSGSSDESIKFWSWPRGKLLKTRKVGTGSIDALAISPNGKLLVSGDRDGIRFWSLPSGRYIKETKKRTSSVDALAISRNGKLLVSGSFFRGINIWSFPRGKHLKSIEIESTSFGSLVISPNSKLLVSGDKEGIKFWSLPKGKQLKTLNVGPGRVEDLAISPNGKLLISTNDTTVKLWSLPCLKLGADSISNKK